jgi:hypothetical protein
MSRANRAKAQENRKTAGPRRVLTPRKKIAQLRTEAELESRIAVALAIAFPNLSGEALVQQRRFTIRLGHETFEFDSAALWEKTGRADILIFHGDRPLAVLEVKRETIDLQKADYEQAQSYANMLTPRPPLVIVSNGTDTRVYDSNAGLPLTPGLDIDATVANLLANVGKIAAADMRWAIEALMGREIDMWPRVMQKCTAKLIEELTDPPGAAGRPIARELLIPRLATQRAAGTAGPTLVIPINGVVPGTPLAADLQELAGLVIGSQLRVILTADQPRD